MLHYEFVAINFLFTSFLSSPPLLSSSLLSHNSSILSSNIRHLYNHLNSLTFFNFSFQKLSFFHMVLYILSIYSFLFPSSFPTFVFFSLYPIFPLPFLLHPSLYVFVFLHPSHNTASSQITITRGEECVLEDNSQRTKWKVISPTGNEAMVPSVCFTIPPPNQEAMDTASR